MLEVLGGAAPPDAIFERVRERDGLRFLGFLLGYARLLRGDEIELVGQMARPYLPMVLPRLRRGTPESRGNAVLMLARMGMPEYADAVADSLGDESPIVAMIAARSLFRPEHEEHFGAVLAHLPRFTVWSRRFLGSMLAGGGGGASPLLRFIMADPRQDPLVRAVASDALRELNDLDSVPVALALVSTEQDRELVAGCLRILKHLGHRDHIPTILAMAESDDPVIRATATSALGAVGGEAEAAVLLERLDDDSFWVSLEAARGLKGLGHTERLEQLAGSDDPRSLLAQQVLAE